MSTTQTIPQLNQRITNAAVEAQAHALEIWRRWANGADIVNARNAYPDAIKAFEAALKAKRVADTEVRAIKEQADDAMADADWDLDGCFETVGNKTSLVRETDGATLDEPRQMTADQRTAWKKTMARKLPAVVEVTQRLRRAESEQAAAGDAIRVAEDRIDAAKYTLQAATAMLTTQAAAHPKEIL